MKVSLVLAASLAFAPVPLPRGQDDEPPSSREVTALVEEYVELDGKSDEGVKRQDEILARLDLLAPIDARDAKDWTKKILKLWDKGPKLEKRGGNHYLWEDDKRGKYIVGGKSGKVKGFFLGMHGGGVGSGDAESSMSYDSGASSADWVAIYPEVLEKTERGWTDSGTEEFVMELIERAFRTWKIDRDKVFFGGHSMGGYGTWTLGAHHADMVAGLIPSAGAPTPYLDASGIADGIVEGVVPNLRNVPMVIFQSDDDPQVPPDANRAAVKELAKAKERWGGFDYEYWEVTGLGHGYPPGGWKALCEKIEERVREPYPERVVWQPTLSWKRHFYWLWWDAPVENAIVLADLDEKTNSIDVKNDGKVAFDWSGLYVLLNDELLDLDEKVTVRVDGKEVFSGFVERSLSTVLRTARRGDERLVFDARVPLK